MTKTKSRHGLDMLAEVPDLRKPRGKPASAIRYFRSCGGSNVVWVSQL